MKIKITIQPGEEEAASGDVEYYCRRYRNVKVRKSERHPPFKHTYLSIKNAENPHKSGETA